MESQSFLSRAGELRGELAEIWHTLHRHPELGNQEHFTSKTIEAELRALGLEVRRVLDTGLAAELIGAEAGRTVVFRADMDALPVQEATGVAFASEIPGCMHACGHDFHVTAALGAARLLAERRDRLRGTVRFLFQPDEEGDGGAARLIAAGCLQGADAVFGAHVSPELPAGTVGVRYGKFYAASDMFNIAVRGRSCHAATPEKGADALAAAAEMVGAAAALRRELTELFGPTVISVGSLRAGTARNVIADTAAMEGIIRTLGPQARAAAVEALRSRVEEIAAAHGVRAEFERRESYPGVVNQDAATAHAEASAVQMLGKDRVLRIDTPTMTTEDFGYYLQCLPGSFYHIGVGGDQPLHSPRFLPDEAALPVAAAVHAQVLYDYLNK